jgi:outer membrane lipoprotein-sorting protein
MRVHLALLLSLASVPTGVASRQASDHQVAEQPLTAEQILERMAKVYADCKSYRDTGSVKTVFIRTDRTWDGVRPFTTAFVRPDRFRYEFKDQQSHGRPDRFLIWKNGEDVRSWWDVDPGIQTASLDMAIAGATGVSGGSAHTIPRMLLPKELEGWVLTELEQQQRKEDADLDGVNCYRIEGKARGDPTTLWIDKKTVLLLRIEQSHQFKDFRTEETTTYTPLVNVDIPEELLVFDPPTPDKH